MCNSDPLSVDELGRNAARALMEYPADALPPSEAFDGAGVYTLHYNGAFPAYAAIGLDVPIYVGKADPPGRRQGRTQASPRCSTAACRNTPSQSMRHPT